MSAAVVSTFISGSINQSSVADPLMTESKSPDWFVEMRQAVGKMWFTESKYPDWLVESEYPDYYDDPLMTESEDLDWDDERVKSIIKMDTFCPKPELTYGTIGEKELMREILGLKAHYNPKREREVWEICEYMALIDPDHSPNLRKEFISLLEDMCNKRVTCRARYMDKVEGATGSAAKDNTFIDINVESLTDVAPGVREPVGDSNTHSPTTNLVDRSNNEMHVQQYTLPDNPYTADICISVDEEMGLHSTNDEIDESSGNPPNPVPNGPPHSSIAREEGQSSRANGGVGGHSPPPQLSGGAGGNSPPPQGSGEPDLIAEEKERRGYVPAVIGGSIAIVLGLGLYTGMMPTRGNPAPLSKADKILLGMIAGPQILAILVLCLYMMRCHPAWMPRKLVFNSAVWLFIVSLLSVVAGVIFLMF